MPDYRRAWHPGGTYFSPSPCCNGMATTCSSARLPFTAASWRR